MGFNPYWEFWWHTSSKILFLVSFFSRLYPVSKDGYHAPTPVNAPSNVIFYFEALCMLSALNRVQTKAPRGSKIVIYTDNENTIDIFWSLKCLTVYNHLLKSAVDTLIKNNYSLCTRHTPGIDNAVADAPPWVKFSVALLAEPELKFYNFNSPVLVGSTKWFIITPDLISQPGQLGLEIDSSVSVLLLWDKPLTNLHLKHTVLLSIPISLSFSYTIYLSNPLLTLSLFMSSSCRIISNHDPSDLIFLASVNNSNLTIPTCEHLDTPHWSTEPWKAAYNFIAHP